MSEKDAEMMSMDGDDVEEDLDEMFGSDMSSGSDSDAPLKPPPAKAEKPKAAKLLPDSSVTATVPATDDEASEDNEHEMAPWEQIDLKPAMDLIRSLTDTSLEAARDFTASMVANTNQLVVGCDSVLLEIKHISDIRETMKRQAKATPASTTATGVACACGTSMMPLGVFPQSAVAPAAPAAPETPVLDKSTEDQTDRVLYKIEAAMEKFRELAEMVQTMSVQHEASLMSKLTIPQTAVQTMVSSIHSAAAAATAAAIAQERGGLSRGTGPGYSFTSEQRTKLQIWYYSYPRPLADELELMAQILSLPPYHSLARAPVHPTHVRDWFKRRRFRERMRHVMQVLEAGTLSLTSAEAEVHAKIELRIQTLREAVKPEELIRELEAARANSATYVTVASSFGKKRNLDQFLSMAQQLGQPTLVLETPVATAVKKPRAGILGDPMEVEDAVVVKVASRVEVQAIQNRLQALLQLPKTTSNTNGIQQVMDLLRSMEITNEVRVSTNLVADLKTVLKIYKKPSLLRRTTEALMEALGQPVDVKKKKRYAAGADVLGHAPASVDDYDDAPLPPAETHGHDDADSEDDQPILKQAKTASGNSRRKKTGAKLHRPMKFSMKQVEALEGWFQKTFKPSVPEMEEYLGRLNAAPLRDPLQTVDVSMTQLRRWFNKRRCLRRPPFALMTKGDEKDATSSQSHDEDDEEDDMDDMDDEDMASEEEARAPLPPPSPSPPPPPPMPPTSIPLPREGSDSSSDSNDSNDSDDDSSDS